MDLDDTAEELYAVPPGDFLAARKEAVARARSGGEKELARQVGALRRPTVAAWLVNQLVRQEHTGSDVDALLALGEQLREAQSDMSGPRLRELTQERRTLVASLVSAAEGIGEEGGLNVPPAVQRELEETFGAAVADPQAADAVLSGRLTRALAYAGFGEVDVSEAVAVPARRPVLRVVRDGETAPRRASEPSPEPASEPASDAEPEPEAARPDPEQQRRDREAARERERELAAAREVVEQAEHVLAAAEDEVAEGSRHRDEAQDRQDTAEREVEELERRLRDARHELSGATDDLRQSDRDLRKVERAERDARAALRRAEASAARLEDG